MLGYDLEYSVLNIQCSTNSMILGRDINLPDNSTKEKEVSDNWKKRQMYVYKYKVSKYHHKQE